MKMPLEIFKNLVDELKGHTFGISLYYCGDPFMHPDVLQMCSYAKRQGIATHISSACSFRWSDAYIERIVDSGLTALTICIDGMTQESYGKTRIGGNVEWALNNLHRILEARARKRSSQPLVEVQYIKFEHNIHELEEARTLVKGWGVDQFADFWGDLHNWSDVQPAYGKPYRKERIPR
jgi:MoaA/NifB/PqqE/SkfB family radical SAM enzyme